MPGVGCLAWRAVGPLSYESDYRAGHDAAFLLHAPSDIELLLEIVRDVQRTGCDRYRLTGESCALYALALFPDAQVRAGWMYVNGCAPCRARVRLEQAAARQAY